MAEPKVALRNIRSIGTIDDPVEVIHVKIIQQLENLSHELSTMGAGTETFAGQTFNTGTNAITHVSNVTSAGTFTTTGAAQINSTLGVTGTATMAAITASGLITANGGITAGGHFTMGTWNLSGAGGNVGLGFSGATAIFSNPVNINALLTMGGNIKLDGHYISGDGDNEGILVNATGQVTCSTIFTANGQIFANGGISGTGITMSGDIRSDGVFNHNGTAGWTGTFDKAVDNTITFAGGIATGKT